MDFLKTLLAYMTLMTALSVQEGPLPAAVPTPTVVPPHVTATLVPFQTEAPTATPSPTPAPVPLLTPSSRYEVLQYSDRGSDVRKLQNKLIELGYMPAGSADGAYGYQTYNAVRDFQKANGLEADGVAGPATLTNLYHNPAILPKATPAPVVTATPTATIAPTFTPTPSPTPSPTPTMTPEVQETITPPEELPDELPQEVFTETAATAAPAASSNGLTAIRNGYVISGSTGKPLSFTQMVDGVPVTVRPGLWYNEEQDAVLALPELVDCMEGWTLMGSSADGQYSFAAAGYEVEISLTEDGPVVTVDGEPVAVDAADVQLIDSVLYITDDFIELTLKASTYFDIEERSFVFFLVDKQIANSAD